MCVKEQRESRRAGEWEWPKTWLPARRRGCFKLWQGVGTAVLTGLKLGGRCAMMQQSEMCAESSAIRAA